MSVAPMYEPPTGISPAEAGTLLDDRIHPRDITSTIVDLAVRGLIKIEETDDNGLLFHHKDYIPIYCKNVRIGVVSLPTSES
jgi:predicted membrane protein DUF2207